MSEVLTSIALGVCLSAACGFRVFAPLLVVSAAGLAGLFTPSEEFLWMSSWTAVALFASATLVEVLAYYIPWADNLLDAIATPSAVVAGVIVSASVLGDIPPLMQWSLAAIAGGGIAGLVQTGTVVLRGASSATTGGLANSLIATGENVIAIATPVLAFLAPFLALFLLISAAVVVAGYISGRRGREGSPRIPPR